jgi:hypothetical protein
MVRVCATVGTKRVSSCGINWLEETCIQPYLALLAARGVVRGAS